MKRSIVQPAARTSERTTKRSARNTLPRSTKVAADTTVGRLLREARQHRGLSLQHASDQLKIPVLQLEALEEGDLSVFSAEVYAQGAFHNYAEFLGVRADSTQRAFQRLLSGAREYVPLRVHSPRPWLHARLTPRWVLAGCIISAALVVGSYVAWQVTSFVRLPRLVLVEPAGVVEGSTVTVRGQAATDATVLVNKEQVLLTDDGSFQLELGVHPGINVIQVEATNAAGRTRVIQRDVLVPRTRE